VKRAAIVLMLAVVAAGALDFLGDRTQTRRDTVQPGSRSEIVLSLSDRNRYDTTQEAAESLWAVCQGTVSNRLAPPGVVPLGQDRFRVVTEPAVGRYGWRRLKGCIEDLSVDQIRGRVISKRDVIPGSRSAGGNGVVE
jgi:hypothetical protein